MIVYGISVGILVGFLLGFAGVVVVVGVVGQALGGAIVLEVAAVVVAAGGVGVGEVVGVVVAAYATLGFGVGGWLFLGHAVVFVQFCCVPRYCSASPG